MRVKSTVFNEQMEMVRLCLDSGVEPDDKTLVWLAFAGALDPLRCLIEKGWSINAVATATFDIFPHMDRQEADISALGAALYAGNDNVVEYLLQHEVDVHIPAGMGGNISPLAASIIQGRLEWTKALLRAGVNPQDHVGLWATALTNNIDAFNLVATSSIVMYGRSIAEYACLAGSEAIRRGNLTFLHAIIAQGLSINKPISPWRSKRSKRNPREHRAPRDHPLLDAVERSNLEAVRLLLSIGANPNIADKCDRYELDDEQYRPDSSLILSQLPTNCPPAVLLSIAGSLIEAGATINDCGETWFHSPLAMAIYRQRSIALIELLIKNGAVVDAVSASSIYGISTPLCEAVCSGSYKVVQLLLAKEHVCPARHS